jgi:hypothetical protein
MMAASNGSCIQTLLKHLAQTSLQPAEQQYFPAPRVHVAVDARFGRPLLQRGYKVWRRRLKSFASRRSFAMHRRDREVMKISGRPLYCTR